SIRYRVAIYRRRRIMPRGEKTRYTRKQERLADHIEKGYKERGIGEQEAERRAWATVNLISGGGKKSGSGRARPTKKVTAKRKSRKRSAAPAKRSAAKRPTSAKRSAAKRASSTRRSTAKRSTSARRSTAKRSTSTRRSAAARSTSTRRSAAARSTS